MQLSFSGTELRQDMTMTDRHGGHKQQEAQAKAQNQS
jgi:hypothetical protein